MLALTDAIPELQEEIKTDRENIQALTTLTAGEFLIWLPNLLCDGPEELGKLLYILGIGFSIENVRNLILSTKKEKEISDIRKYQTILKESPKAIDYFNQSENAYKCLNYGTQYTQTERFNRLKEMEIEGRLPISLLGVETKTGATPDEILSLSFHKYLEQSDSYAKTEVPKQYARF